MQPKDPSENHFYASIVKSIARLGACGYLYFGDIQSAAAMFFAAELIGIAEEVV